MTCHYGFPTFWTFPSFFCSFCESFFSALFLVIGLVLSLLSLHSFLKWLKAQLRSTGSF